MIGFSQADICAVNGALQYLVEMLRFQDAPSKTLAIIENAGGILRNISSHIAVREDYRYGKCDFTIKLTKLLKVTCHPVPERLHTIVCFNCYIILERLYI